MPLPKFAYKFQTASYNKARKGGAKNPFDIGAGLVICSYQFASAKADELRMIPWDLVSLMKPTV